MSYIDLHVHSCASDGTMTPEEVVDCAARAGLSAIALTDHDTQPGVSRALRQEEKKRRERPVPSHRPAAEIPGESGNFHAAGTAMGRRRKYTC